MDEQRGGDGTRGLTPAEVASVLRRASELDAEASAPRPLPEVVAPTVVEEAGVEAGISREAMRRALGELVVAPLPGAIEVAPSQLPDTVEVLREVPGPAKDVSGRVERFLRRQIFVRQRIYDNGSRWAPRRGLFATLRRWLGPRSRHALRPVQAVDVRVAVDPNSEDRLVFVRIDADVSGLRRRIIGGTAATTVIVAGGSGWLVAVNSAPEMLLVLVPLSGGAIAGTLYGARALARRAVVRIETALHGLVDRIEHGPRDAKASLKAAVRAQRDAAVLEAAEHLESSWTTSRGARRGPSRGPSRGSSRGSSSSSRRSRDSGTRTESRPEPDGSDTDVPDTPPDG